MSKTLSSIIIVYLLTFNSLNQLRTLQNCRTKEPLQTPFLFGENDSSDETVSNEAEVCRKLIAKNENITYKFKKYREDGISVEMSFNLKRKKIQMKKRMVIKILLDKNREKFDNYEDGDDFTFYYKSEEINCYNRITKKNVSPVLELSYGDQVICQIVTVDDLEGEVVVKGVDTVTQGDSNEERYSSDSDDRLMV